jgi:hypothetical protein
MVEAHVLRLFKAMVVDSAAIGPMDLLTAGHGYITNFVPTPIQHKLLREEFKPLDLRTLFTVRERESGSVEGLILKQILHYIEVYGLNSPGLFNLEQENGEVLTIAYVQGITVDQLGEKVRTLLYTNAPIKDTVALKEIINAYGVEYDLNQVKNNEMKMLLFRLGKDLFKSGDDAVRYMCYVATDSPLLIKSRQVIKAIKAKRDLFTTPFFLNHEKPLAQVFHRHKNLILAAKHGENRSIINRISRDAKDEHVPIHEPISKRYIAEAYAGRVKPDVLSKMTVRDKFKFLNLITYKSAGNTTDAFVIRNGKVHLEKGRKVLNVEKLDAMTYTILDSLKEDLKHLKDKVILLDPYVDYGLPISRKQVIGQLPFGTTVSVEGGTISAGIYWENSWGARDLDLSAVDATGGRTGWGRISGYGSRDVVFSGDLTDATNGAMEFMTSKVDFKTPYALFVNIFAGEEGVKCVVVVGNKTKDKWIENLVLQEVTELESRGNILGFVKNGQFIVYNCRVNSAYWSEGSKEKALVQRGLAGFWTLKTLFFALGIPYYENANPEASYDYDLTYKGFSLDKLEAMINNT